MGLTISIPLTDHIAEHLASTEGEHGLYAEIAATDPRLHFAVRRLLREHKQLRRALYKRLSAAEEAAVAELLDRHRQRGNDLVYEAFAVDLGGED